MLYSTESRREYREINLLTGDFASCSIGTSTVITFAVSLAHSRSVSVRWRVIMGERERIDLTDEGVQRGGR